MATSSGCGVVRGHGRGLFLWQFSHGSGLWKGLLQFGGNFVCHFITMDANVCFDFLEGDGGACLTSGLQHFRDGFQGVSVGMVGEFMWLLEVFLDLEEAA